MLRLLQIRAKKGIDIRVLGKAGPCGAGLRVQKLPGLRLHVRALIRDGDTVFVGSQSLRALELDARREVGLIVRDPAASSGCRRSSTRTGRRRTSAEKSRRSSRRNRGWPRPRTSPRWLTTARRYAGDRIRATARPTWSDA